MTFYLVSSDKNDYGTIKFRSSINTANCMVAYRINALSTFSCFSMTTPDDYMIIETTAPINKNEEEEEIVIINEEEATNQTTNEEETTNEQTTEPELIELTLRFHNHGAYEMRTLAYELNNLFEGDLESVEGSPPIEFLISMDSTNRLIISANKEFVIKEASHRAKLLLGLYDTQLPITSTNKTINSPSVPFLCYGNVLYLTARTDFISSLNLGDKEITRSICYRINELLYPGVPICSKLPGSWSIIHSDQLSTLEFRLVDFKLEPVILHAPLFITLEIERLDKSDFLPVINDR